jgi:hypothetical protein
MKLFITSDIISLILQAAGGAISSSANTTSASDVGVHIMVAGLAFQVVSLVAFAGLCTHFAWRVRKSNSKAQGFICSPARFHLFLYSKF